MIKSVSPSRILFQIDRHIENCPVDHFSSGFHYYELSTETGALFLLGKEMRILILAPDMSKTKAVASVVKGLT